MSLDIWRIHTARTKTTNNKWFIVFPLHWKTRAKGLFVWCFLFLIPMSYHIIRLSFVCFRFEFCGVWLAYGYDYHRLSPNQTGVNISAFVLMDPPSLQIRADRSVASPSTWDRWQREWMHVLGTCVRTFRPDRHFVTFLLHGALSYGKKTNLNKNNAVTQITVFV